MISNKKPVNRRWNEFLKKDHGKKIKKLYFQQRETMNWESEILGTVMENQERGKEWNMWEIEIRKWGIGNEI